MKQVGKKFLFLTSPSFNWSHGWISKSNL